MQKVEEEILPIYKPEKTHNFVQNLKDNFWNPQTEEWRIVKISSLLVFTIIILREIFMPISYKITVQSFKQVFDPVKEWRQKEADKDKEKKEEKESQQNNSDVESTQKQEFKNLAPLSPLPTSSSKSSVPNLYIKSQKLTGYIEISSNNKLPIDVTLSKKNHLSGI